MAGTEELKKVVKTLRSEKGCAWDKVQTHESIKAGCIEEAAEVIGGINILKETGDPANLKEELGDLLFQVMFHCVLAEEEGLFDFEDVVDGICEKMIRRHPHVFSGAVFETREALHEAWVQIKKKEKEGREWEADFLPEAFRESGELLNKARARKERKLQEKKRS